MSLFAGISFTSAKAKALAAESAATAAESSQPEARLDGGSGGAQAGPSSTVERPVKPTSPLPASAVLASLSSTTAIPSRSQASSSSAKSAAALQFAPRINKPKPQKPPVVVYSSEPVLSAAPVLVDTSRQQATQDQGAKGENEDARAPAMTIAPKRRADLKRKKKKKRRHVVHAFNPDEEYDPSRPNDLGEYQAYRVRIRLERGDSSSESDEGPRRDAPKLWAPPKEYAASSVPAAANPYARIPSREKDRERTPPRAMAETGDEAYARRMPMSTGDDAYARRAAMTAASGDDAYARRMALSQPQASQPSLPAGLPPRPPSTLPGPPLSLPSGLPPRPPPGFPLRPAAPPPRPQGLPPAPPPLLPGMPTPPMPPTRPSAPPGLPLPPMSPMRPPDARAPPGLPPPPFPPPNATSAGPPLPPADDSYAKEVEAKRAAAMAIAAKFGMAPKEPEPVDDDPSGTFAERMMRKWGHKEGSGIGARGDGLIHALMAEHVTPASALSNAKKRAAAKARAAKVNQRKWVQQPIARGRIIDASASAARAAEAERHGEASRVVVLLNTVGEEDDVDEALADDIGEECSKHGIVERVVLHLVEPPIEAEGCLRVFVVFSGMAGAWRAVKALEGRFFGGRTIHARYFDEERFERGDRDGEL